VRHGDPLQVVLLQPGAHPHGGPPPGDAGQLQLPAAGGGGAAQASQTRWVQEHVGSVGALGTSVRPLHFQIANRNSPVQNGFSCVIVGSTLLLFVSIVFIVIVVIFIV